MRNGQPREAGLGTGVALALLLALTRLGHFGGDIVPWDASWAVFLLGGALLGGAPAFLGLCALAGAVDLVSFVLGVSAVCMSPGYLFSLAGYGALWWAGRLGGAGEFRQLPRVGVAAVLGALVAFAITNAGYFAFSKSLASMSAGNFVVGVAPYLPSYVLATLFFTLTGHLLVHAAASVHRAARPQRSDAG